METYEKDIRNRRAGEKESKKRLNQKEIVKREKQIEKRERQSAMGFNCLSDDDAIVEEQLESLKLNEKAKQEDQAKINQVKKENFEKDFMDLAFGKSPKDPRKLESYEEKIRNFKLNKSQSAAVVAGDENKRKALMSFLGGLQ